jgi:hypothetical protein
VSQHLQAYLQVLATNLEQSAANPQGDFRIKEAVMHSLGNLQDQIMASADLQASIEPLLKAYVFSELGSDNPFMRMRACWLYGRFGKMPNCFASEQGQEHLKHALNSIYQNLNHEALPVRVEAALALNSLLKVYQLAVDFLRPGLELVLRTFLKIMDDIDFDELVEALRQLVEEYQEEIAPYAISLCTKLGEAYLRLIA